MNILEGLAISYIISLLSFIPTLIASIIICILKDKKRLRENPDTKPYKWGYFIGWFFSISSIIGILSYSLIVQNNIWDRSYEQLGLSTDFYYKYALFAFIYSFFFLLIPGVLIIFRNKLCRFAWIIHTAMTFNPIYWIINDIYLKNRWKELDARQINSESIEQEVPEKKQEKDKKKEHEKKNERTNLEKGILRLTIAVSIFMFFIGFFIFGNLKHRYFDFEEAFIAAIIFGIAPWVINYTTRWVLKGFNKKVENKE